MVKAGTHKEKTPYGTPTYDKREIFQKLFFNEYNKRFPNGFIWLPRRPLVGSREIDLHDT